MTGPINTKRVADLLEGWVAGVAKEGGLEWLKSKRKEAEEGGPLWRFFASFSAVPRYVGKADLKLESDDLEVAESTRRGWRPGRWSADQAGRTLLVLSYPHEDASIYRKVLDQIFSTADVGESVALYQALSVFPHPEAFRGRAAEGVRSSMTSIFEAVALDNPYPAEYFDDAAWNQLVLKAVFVGSPLHRLEGIDRRANPELARMLVDYAHERWSASRPVTPELWRPVGPYAGDEYLDDLDRVLKSDTDEDRAAAALALSAAGTEAAAALLETRPNLRDQVVGGELTWDEWARERGVGGG